MLFQRDKPELVHRMKKDSNAKEVVRQLDLADGVTEPTFSEDPSRQEAKTLYESEGDDLGPNPTDKPLRGAQQPDNLSGGAIDAQQPVSSRPQAFLPGNFGVQNQLLAQGLAAQRQMEWQRQQMAFGSMHPSTWGGLGSWSMPPHTLPSASAFAFGLHQQQQLLQSGAAAAQHAALESSVGHSRTPSHEALSGDARSIVSRDKRTAKNEQHHQMAGPSIAEDEGESRPSEPEED